MGWPKIYVRCIWNIYESAVRDTNSNYLSTFFLPTVRAPTRLLVKKPVSGPLVSPIKNECKKTQFPLSKNHSPKSTKSYQHKN